MTLSQHAKSLWEQLSGRPASLGDIGCTFAQEQLGWALEEGLRGFMHLHRVETMGVGPRDTGQRSALESFGPRPCPRITLGTWLFVGPWYLQRAGGIVPQADIVSGHPERQSTGARGPHLLHGIGSVSAALGQWQLGLPGRSLLSFRHCSRGKLRL